MPSATHARTMPRTAVVFVGVAAFVIGLFAAPTGTPQPAALAQDGCLELASTGCPLEIGNPVGAALTSPTATHNWLLNVAAGLDFTVTLMAPPADYQLWVYGPDGSLRGISNNPGTQDENVQVTNTGGGTYWIVVDSPLGEWTTSPYALIATTEPAAVPFDSYSAPPPPPRPFGPYR